MSRFRTAPATVAFVAVLTASGGAQNARDSGLESIQLDALKAHVYFLAADEMKGRDSLSPEGRIAANYVAAFFARAGLQPIGDDHTYFQRFRMVQQGIDRAESFLGAAIAVDGRVETKRFAEGADFTLSRNGPDATVDAPLVFGGVGDDDFRSVDVRGKVVLLIPRNPPGADPRFGGRMNVTETQADVARKRGAAAILTVRSANPSPPRRRRSRAVRRAAPS